MTTELRPRYSCVMSVDRSIGFDAREIVACWLASDRTKYLDLSHLNLTELPDNFPSDFDGRLKCYFNQLTSLSLPMAREVICSNNKLTLLNTPTASNVYCANNQLTTLSLPSATEVNCSNNQLISLFTPKATKVDITADIGCLIAEYCFL